jgi:hypothetical protein
LEANDMIVIGLDVHKQTVTAVAVDEAGRPLDEAVIPVGSDELLGWASALDRERCGRWRTVGSSPAGWNASC